MLIKRNNYESEIKERWGEAKAYSEYWEKSQSYSKDKWQEVNKGLNNIFGTYSESLTTSQNYSQFKLEYKEIETVEIKDGLLHIYSKIGLIKLAIDLPYEARRMILEEITPEETIYEPLFKDHS